MITSVANEKVKYVRSLYRRRVRYRERRFVIEGVRLMREAIRAGIMPALVFYSEGMDVIPSGRELLAEVQEVNLPTFAVSERVMRAMTDTVSPQGVLAVVPFVGLSPLASPKLADFLRQQGYIVEISEESQLYSHYFDQAEFIAEQERPLLAQIERSDRPLVRLGRWPDGARSALSITGDIDALTLWDYGLRLFGK